MANATSSTKTLSTADLIVRELELSTVARRFSTGSVGYFTSSKLVADGQRFQMTLTASVIGSKNDPDAEIPSADSIPDLVSEVAFGIVPKEFKPKNGRERHGYGSYGKAIVDGQRLSYSLNVTPIV